MPVRTARRSNAKPKTSATASSAGSRTVRARSDSGAPADFAKTFALVKRVFQSAARRAVVTADTASLYRFASPTVKDRVGRPLMVGSVEIKKTYVSVHLIPVYASPTLAATVSPALKKRMQGKACFNFTVIEPGHLVELGALVRKGMPLIERLDLPWATRA